MTNINYYTYLHTQTWIVEFKRHVYQLQKPASVLLRMREHIESYKKYAMIWFRERDLPPSTLSLPLSVCDTLTSISIILKKKQQQQISQHTHTHFVNSKNNNNNNETMKVAKLLAPATTTIRKKPNCVIDTIFGVCVLCAPSKANCQQTA